MGTEGLESPLRKSESGISHHTRYLKNSPTPTSEDKHQTHKNSIGERS